MDVSPSFCLSVDGTTRDIFMSYGLINELAKIVGSPERVPAILVDHELREDVMIALLAERKPSGKIIRDLDIDDMLLETAEVHRLLEWAVKHLLSFFVGSLTLVKKASDEIAPTLQALGSLEIGSQGSVGNTA